MMHFYSDFAPNRSIAVIKFSNPVNASEFATEYNGKPFNSMEVICTSTLIPACTHLTPSPRSVMLFTSSLSLWTMKTHLSKPFPKTMCLNCPHALSVSSGWTRQ